MRTSLSTALKAGILPPDCGEVIINLLKISHSLIGTLWLCDSQENFVSAGQAFLAWGFVGGLNDEVENEIPNPVILFDATDQAILQAIQTAFDGDIREKVLIEHWFVTEDEPDTNQLPRKIPYYITAFDVEQDDDGEILSAHMELMAITNKTWPAHAMCPQYAPRLFGGASAA